MSAGSSTVPLIPAKAGTQAFLLYGPKPERSRKNLDPGLRRDARIFGGRS